MIQCRLLHAFLCTQTFTHTLHFWNIAASRSFSVARFLVCFGWFGHLVDARCLVHFLVLLSNGVFHRDWCILLSFAFLATAVDAFDLKVRVPLALLSTSLL